MHVGIESPPGQAWLYPLIALDDVAVVIRQREDVPQDRRRRIEGVVEVAVLQEGGFSYPPHGCPPAPDSRLRR